MLLLRLHSGAEYLGYVPDGTHAYEHYIFGRGADLDIDYEKAISEDGLILQGFEAELNGAQVDIEKSHDGKLVKFKVYSQDGRLVRTETDNWSKALGGHQIWGSGEVEFDPVKCKYKLTIEIEIEDFYNFNNGQYDIMTGLPDSENGRFEVFGWANSFFSRGKV